MIPRGVYRKIPHRFPKQYKWNNNSLHYDNLTNDVITVASHASIDDLTQFTWEIWVYLMGYVNLNRIFEKIRKDTFITAGLNLRSIIQAVAPGTNAIATTIETLALNRWTHVLITYDDLGDRMNHIHLHSVEATYSANVALTGVLQSEAGNVLSIGNISTLVRGWYGYITEPRWFNRVLTAEERRASYHRGYAKVEAGCVLALRMNEGSGLTLVDSSLSGNDGVITGAEWREDKLYELLAEAGV